jgi:hypothetical protein
MNKTGNVRVKSTGSSVSVVTSSGTERVDGDWSFDV